MPTFMRSIAPAVLVGTAAFTVVATAPHEEAATDTEPVSSPVAGTDSSTNNSGSSSGSTASSGGSTTSGGTSSNSKKSQATATPTPTPTPTATATTCANAKEITGPVANTQWGPVQVAATIANGKVCAVRTLQYPDGDRKSASINARAVPMLEAQAEAAGSANIDGVSGATFTSMGYVTSLQGAIDRA